MAEATTSASRFKEHFLRHIQKMRAAQDNSRIIDVSSVTTSSIPYSRQALNADPYDIEAQKHIEEEIRNAAIEENWQHAVEFAVSVARPLMSPNLTSA